MFSCRCSECSGGTCISRANDDLIRTPTSPQGTSAPAIGFGVPGHAGAARRHGVGLPAPRKGRGAARPARLFVHIDCSAHSPCVWAAASGALLCRTVKASDTSGCVRRLALRGQPEPSSLSNPQGDEGLASPLSHRKCSAPAGSCDENRSQWQC